MDFPFKPEYEPLIEAAIGLGDWLTDRLETTPEQEEAIHVLQAALRRLPEPTPNLDASYGLHLHPSGEKAEGVWRYWSVSMDDQEGLSLHSCYSPFPEVDIWEQLDHELFFGLKPGQPDYNGDFYHREWIAEVSSPEAFLQEGICLEVDAEMCIN